MLSELLKVLFDLHFFFLGRVVLMVVVVVVVVVVIMQTLDSLFHVRCQLYQLKCHVRMHGWHPGPCTVHHCGTLLKLTAK